MANKDQILSDLKDLIDTLSKKSIELKNDPEFFAKWNAKNKRLHSEAAKLNPQEVKEIESEYREWLKHEHPEIRLTQIQQK